MRGPKDIEELLQRIADQAKKLPKEQAQTVAACVEHALRGAQDDAWYEIIDSIYDHTNQPQKPLVQIGTMNGDINALEKKEDNHDNSNQQSLRGCKCLHE